MKNGKNISPALFVALSLGGAILLLFLVFLLSQFFDFDFLFADISSSDGALGEIDQGTSLPSGSVFDLIQSAIKVILGLFSVLLTGVALWSGTLFVIHFGEEEQVTNARRLLMWSLVGVAVTASSYALVSGVINLNLGN